MDAKELAQTFNELSSHIASSENGICSVRRELLQRARAALYDAPSDAAQAPMAWARPDVAERLSSPLAIGIVTELMKKQKDGYVPIYADPVTTQAAGDAAQAPEPVAYCRGDTVLNWKGQLVNAAMMFPSPMGLKDPIALYAAPVAVAAVAQPDAAHTPTVAADMASDGKKILENLWNDPNGLMLRGQWQAHDAAPQAMLTDEQILNAFELSGVEFQEVYSTTLKKWLPLTKGTQNANRLISAVRALLGAQPPRIPIYQIGAPGIAGHQVVWWDVPQEEYERQKAAGFMKTGIVYREGE